MKLEQVLTNNLCLGCGLCESVFGSDCIEMKYDGEGFLRPKMNKPLTENKQKLFSNICPGIQIKHLNTKGHDPFLGPFIKIEIGYSNDESIRHSGSSGGVITALANFLLEENKVDKILQIGALKENPIKSSFAVSGSKSELITNAGSRYAPSATLVSIRQIINEESIKSIAVIGKPCDIVGVRNLISKDSNAEQKIKYLLSFMCAGIPSLKGTLNIINDFGVATDTVKELKYRGEGWPGYFKVVDKSNRVYKKSYSESWGTELNKHLQFRCKICPDGTGEFADITCADAWESSENGFPSFVERPGQSLIISRTESGRKLLQEAKMKKHVIIQNQPVSVDSVKKMQPYQLNRKQNLTARLLALSVSGIGAHNYNRAILFKNSLKENPFRLLKNFIGTLKRLRF